MVRHLSGFFLKLGMQILRWTDFNVTNFEYIREQFLKKEHPSSLFDLGEFTGILFRYLEVGEDELLGVSQGLLINGEDFYFYDRQNDQFVRQSTELEGLTRFIIGKHTTNSQILDSYIDGIDQLEDNLYDRKIQPLFMDSWFDYKKDIHKIERYLFRNLQFLTELVGRLEERGETVLELKSLIERTRIRRSNATIQVSRLDGLHHYYNSIKNDRVNRNIYILTLVSGFFLPLNLIVGFFGMNTSGLFFTDGSGGTYSVIYILLIVAGSFTIGFPLIKFIEKSILRVLLGRYSFYKKLTVRLDTFSNKL